MRLTEDQKRLKAWKKLYAPLSPEDTPDSRYLEACQQLDDVEYLLEVLTSGTSDERNEVIQTLMTDNEWKEEGEHERQRLSDGRAL